jgi:hypothetical protein
MSDPDSAGKKSESPTLWNKPFPRTTLSLVLYQENIIKMKNIVSVQNVKLF